MTDREKVIKGLKHCIGDNCSGDKWYECEYSGHGCIDALLEDALTLLKAQEPTVMTLEEVQQHSEEWGWIVNNCFHEKCVELGYCPEKHGCGKYPKAGE